MTRVQKAVFPGIIIGCLFLVLFTSLIASPNIALASTLPPAATPEAGEGEVLPPEAAASVENADSSELLDELVNNAQQAGDTANIDTSGACSISSGYPQAIQQWCSYIDYYAAQNQVDPNLIAAVMLQESAGNPDAYSKSGAVGLMQVMPRDGLAAKFMCINGPCFASRPSIEELYNPEFNIEYGTRMLADLIRRHGDVREALKSYGPMNVGYYYADIVLGIFNRY